jgi:hypothetical protein
MMEKEFKNIDDLLRTTLAGFEKKPTEGVWQKISAALSRGSVFGILSSKILWSLLGLLIIVSMIFFFGYNFNSNTDTVNSSKQLELPISNDQLVKPEGEPKGNMAAAPIKENSNQRVKQKDEKEGVEINEEDKAIETKINYTNTAIPESLGIVPLPDTDAEINSNSGNLKKETFLLTGYYPYLKKGTFDKQLLAEHAMVMIPEYIKYRNNTLALNLPGSVPATSDDYGKEQNLLYGISIVPELIFPGSDKTNKGIGMELTGRYWMKDFYLETGLGLTFSDDDGHYQIDYEQYDSIGYYYKVNSFTIDEGTGQPVFNTDLESVYDTVDYTTSESTRNTYTYLYLPLYAGVKLYEFRRLSLNLQAGIIYSVMIGQHEPEASYTNDNATRIYITNENPARISSNWIVAASVGLQYQISPSLGLNIEPMIKYYLKPVYEQRYDPKSTFGTGLRVGLYVKF